MKQYFFVSTFGSIQTRVFPLIEYKKNEGDIVIVASNNEIYRFFKEFTPYETIVLDNPNLFSKKRKLYFIIDLIKNKLEYNKKFKDITNSNIYFFGRGWTVGMFLHIQRLSKNNKVYTYLANTHEEKRTHKKGLRSLLIEFFYWFVCNIDINVVSDTGFTSLELNNYFYIKNNIKVLDLKLPESPVSPVKLDILKDKTVLFILDDLVSYGFMNNSDFQKQLCDIVSLLQKNFPDKYLIKPRPNDNSHYENALPPYIPVEFLLTGQWKLIIGFESLSLLTSSSLTNAKIVSLVDILKYTDLKRHKEIKEWLKKESSSILFPESYTELDNIMVEVNEK